MILIDKDAVLAEIERRYETYLIGAHSAFRNGKIEALREVKDFLNTLEVKEVDDEPECKIIPRPVECYSTCKECPWSATNNKAQKGE